MNWKGTCNTALQKEKEKWNLPQNITTLKSMGTGYVMIVHMVLACFLISSARKERQLFDLQVHMTNGDEH